MNTTTENKIVEFDASGRRLGKLATEVAVILMGKDQPDFAKHVIAPVRVKVSNLSKLDIPEHKEKEIYQSYSGYPGGRNEEPLIHLAKRLGYSEVFSRTVKGMLPKNKLQSKLLLNLELSE
jgi:large subunit ribosomal protein L13